jgi:hypothetical protein
MMALGRNGLRRKWSLKSNFNLRKNEKMTLEQYIDNLDKRYRLGNATEHTFRGDLQ